MKIRFALPIVFAFAFPNLVMPLQADIVPGTGQQIVEVFDDFEDTNWNYTPNLPKASANIDHVERHPSGFSDNRLFLESLYRGTPDFVRRVPTPPGGIPGSTGSLAMQTLNSGIPGQLSHTFQQDDLIASVQQKLGYMLPVSWTPSYVCRVYVPPFDKWERRHGTHFGFRADCTTTITDTKSMGRFFKNFGSSKKLEQYWPGFFIQLHLKQQSGQKEDYASIEIRSDGLGHEVAGPKITHPGWWTLGMTFTPDGRVHYYGHEGVHNLSAKDHLYSGLPYGYRCEQTSTYFFNIVNQDDGRSWSTRWIVDDPKVYVATGNYRPTVPQQAAQKTPATTQTQAPAQAPAQTPAQTPSQIPAQPTTVASPAPVKTTATPTSTTPVAKLSTKPATTASTPQLAARPSDGSAVKKAAGTPNPQAVTPSQLAVQPALIPEPSPQTTETVKVETKPEVASVGEINGAPVASDEPASAVSPSVVPAPAEPE